MVNHSGSILWQERSRGFYSYPVMTGDFDGDGINNDTLWTWGVGTLDPLRAFRWGGPRITFQFLDPINTSVPIDKMVFLRINISSTEPNFSFTVNLSAGAGNVEVTLSPNGSKAVSCPVHLNQTGPNQLTVFLSYYGGIFSSATLPVIGVLGVIPISFWGVLVACGLIIGCMYFQRKRNRTLFQK